MRSTPRSGAIRWKHASGGRISGSATVVGNVVYYANLGTKTTIGLNDATGKQVFSFKDGAFTPVIADYHAIYLVGYGEIYQMLPPAPKPKHPPVPVHKPSKHQPKPKHKAKSQHKTQSKHKTQPKHEAKPKQKPKQKAKPKHEAKSRPKHASKPSQPSTARTCPRRASRQAAARISDRKRARRTPPSTKNTDSACASLC